MLSVCIPIYNFDVTELVSALHQQAQKLGIPYEIICIDDGSTDFFKQKNKDVCGNYSKYIELPDNIGRAKIRNLFLNYVQYNYLLFLDCDSVIISNDFIEKYIELIKKGELAVICGGRIYDNARPGRQNLLRWLYGHKKESMPVSVRQQNTDKSFMTNNFIIQKEILNEIKFDEQIVQYGHEDTLFGFQLKKRQISVTHTDNPVLNGNLENNAEFVAKTEQGLENLIKIFNYIGSDGELIEDVTLLKYYQKISNRHLTPIIVFLFIIFKPILKFILITGFAPLWVFDFYKLGFFSKKIKELRNP